MYSFRTNTGNANEGVSLQKMIQNGAQNADLGVSINATVPGNQAPLPILLRLERVGGGFTYRGWVSEDNGATWQFQSRVRPTANGAELQNPLIPMEVGLSSMFFGGPDAGQPPMGGPPPTNKTLGIAQFDDFVLEYYDPLPAPGAPVLPSSMVIVHPRDNNGNAQRNNVLNAVINEMSGLPQGPLQWSLTANPAGYPPNPANPPGATTLRQLPGLFPGLNTAGVAPLTDAIGVPIDPFPLGSDGPATNFRWDTAVMPNGMNVAQPFTPGYYRWIVRATNDWGQVSNDMLLVVRLLVPEPTSALIAAMACFAMAGFTRRRR
jgi:hypothetical protein